MMTANNVVAFFVCFGMASSYAEVADGHTTSASSGSHTTSASSGIWLAHGKTKATRPDMRGKVENISQRNIVVDHKYRYSATSLISCWPDEEKVQNGRFKIKQNLKFTLKCKPNYTRALGSSYSWKCNETVKGPAFPIPVACLEILLPDFIFLEADVKVQLTDFYRCDANYPKNVGTIIKRKGQTLSIEGFKFEMNSSPSKGCTIGFDKMGSKVDVFYHFVLQHKPDPRKTRLPKQLLNKTRSSMQQMVLQIMKELKAKAEILNFNITMADKFSAGPCSREGAMVEDAESRFDVDLPICRQCPAGWFVNKWEKRCNTCGRGYYSDKPGATGCTYCPTVHEGSKSTTATRKDCYDDYESANNRSLSIRTGAVLFIMSNIIYLAVLTFHVRNEITKILKKTAHQQSSKQ